MGERMLNLRVEGKVKVYQRLPWSGPGLGLFAPHNPPTALARIRFRRFHKVPYLPKVPSKPSRPFLLAMCCSRQFQATTI